MALPGARIAGLAASKRVLGGRAAPTLQVVREKHYLLMYDYVEGILEKRGPYRPEHLGNAQKQLEAGFIKAGGAYNEGKGAVFHFECDDKEHIEEFVKNDPYYKNGLIPSYNIYEWTLAIQKE
mmetsp:Transcript_7510/g.14863  ORF Transcript_7510/g.14863 Transcript_7510/m.14863 type:complete len:123 (+) Transcript_7510:127-495(+)